MSFARKIIKWNLANAANLAKPEQESEQESTQADVLPIDAHQNGFSWIAASTNLKETETSPPLATIAALAKGPTFKTEVIEVYNPKLRRRIEANGLTPEDALALAIKLQARRADFDDRRVCHECQHYTRKLCTNAKNAGLSVRLHLMQVPTGTAEQMQRCPGYLTAND